MLAVALEAMKREQLGNLSFVEADASVASLPAEYDLLFSRFGMMFFGDPEAAFTHLRKFLRPGGRMVFICWRHPRDNPWAMTPFVAARKSVAVEMAPGDPTAPGPFSLADENRLRDLLSRAGLRNVRVERFDAPVVLGVDVRAAADAAMRFGPTARLVREMGSGHAETIRQAVEAALAPAAGPEGHVRLNGSTWIVSAENTPSV
jgi:SAM-dependent methyltransferase